MLLRIVTILLSFRFAYSAIDGTVPFPSTLTYCGGTITGTVEYGTSSAEAWVFQTFSDSLVTFHTCNSAGDFTEGLVLYDYNAGNPAGSTELAECYHSTGTGCDVCPGHGFLTDWTVNFVLPAYEVYYIEIYSYEPTPTPYQIDIECNPAPTPAVTVQPTSSPVTDQPTTNSPTAAPSTSEPTMSPTNNPSTSPSKYPTKYPTNNPSVSPTNVPSVPPTKYPSNFPSSNPSFSPTKNPTKYPTVNPTPQPTHPDTVVCPDTSSGAYYGGILQFEVQIPYNGDITFNATASAFEITQVIGYENDAGSPGTQIAADDNGDHILTLTNLNADSYIFTIQGSANGMFDVTITCSSDSPTQYPSTNPSVSPTDYPSNVPSQFPTTFPTKFPTDTPSQNPSVSPTQNPSNMPTNSPTKPGANGEAEHSTMYNTGALMSNDSMAGMDVLHWLLIIIIAVMGIIILIGAIGCCICFRGKNNNSNKSELQKQEKQIEMGSVAPFDGPMNNTTGNTTQTGTDTPSNNAIIRVTSVSSMSVDGIGTGSGDNLTGMGQNVSNINLIEDDDTGTDTGQDMYGSEDEINGDTPGNNVLVTPGHAEVDFMNINEDNGEGNILNEDGMGNEDHEMDAMYDKENKYKTVGQM